MLLDLERSIESCKRNYDNRTRKGEVRLTDEFKKKFTDIQTNISHVQYGNYSVIITTDENRKVEFPSSWFWYAIDFYPLWGALETYKELLKEVVTEAKSKANNSVSPKMNDFLKTLPDKDWKTSTNPWVPFFDNAIKTVTNSQNDSDLFHKFVAEPEWWNKPVDSTSSKITYKKLNRTDVYQSCLESAMKVLAASASWLYKVIGDFSKNRDLRDCFDNMVKQNLQSSISSTVKAQVGTNKVLYGAPGTGKSHKIDSLIKNAGYVRTVFHPDYMYSDFIGSLKPSTETDGNISYSFRPGPFTDILIAAFKDPQHHYFLVIEELNRAAAASVFGDIFQLLDRSNVSASKGRSKYTITISDPELTRHFESIIPYVALNNELYLPSNLSLLATMNSSDQAVMPLDTAFKRRWEFEYLPLNFDGSCALGSIVLFDTKKNELTITWSKFAQEINQKLKNLSSPIPEDRLLGPWFVTSEELANSPDTVLTGKLFSYLWDDVLRHGLAAELFRPNIRTYGDLVGAQQNEEAVFNDQFLQSLIES